MRNEVGNHKSWIERIVANGRELIDEGHENAAQFQTLIDELNAKWAELKQALDARKERLEESETAHQYIFDTNEAESYMSEQEL